MENTTKNLEKYQLKSTDIIKDLDDEKRQVAIYLSTFDVMDSDFDVIKKGAFKKSIKERGVNSKSNRKIAFLRYHDWEKPIGKFIELNEDDKGLFAVGQLGTSTLGDDAWADYKDGIIREHSIGFQYVDGKSKWIEDKSIDSGGYFEIKEVKLWEGSAVTFGSNEYTNVIDVIKSKEKPNYAMKLFNEITTLQKSLVNGYGTDERLHSIDMKLKYLITQLTTLATNEDPSLTQSLKLADAENIKPFDWHTVVKSLRS